ncbi:MAG: hypothetical protein AB1486_02490 [Planctomycetota bacterium]
MSDDEMVVFVIAAGVVVASMLATTTAGLHPLCLARNPGTGLVRSAIIGGMVWTGLVLAFYADPSVKGIYILFYLVLGYAVIKSFGQVAGRLFGVSMRIDVGERRNWAAAVFLSAFTLGTGFVFGGSLWGEADPEGSGEGGWWVPLGFFLLGWGVMAGAVAVYLVREPGHFRTAIRQERSTAAATGAASFTVSTAILMTQAVSGDFFGWGEGLKDVGLAAAMLLAHEFLRAPSGSPAATSTRRVVECALYLSLAAVSVLLNWLR